MIRRYGFRDRGSMRDMPNVSIEMSKGSQIFQDENGALDIAFSLDCGYLPLEL
jgi:hypothetical protein